MLQQYQLPTSVIYDKEKVFKVLTSDKKKEGSDMNFVLLQNIGKAIIEKIPLQTLNDYL